MALILAIEADRRQAGYLVQIVNRRLGAELILAETFEEVLKVLDNRVPDLILVPALLSPEDDASLKFVLRVIAGTSHVQVLTTPTFATPGTKRASRGVLPRFLRSRADGAVDGCDHDEFAKHIASYLHTAQEKRTAAPVPSLSPRLPEPVESLPVTRGAVVEEPVLETPPQAQRVVDAARELESSLDRRVADLAARFAAARTVAGAEVPVAPRQDPPVEPPAIEPGASQTSSNEWGLFDPKR
jgi:hypothetical protein